MKVLNAKCMGMTGVSGGGCRDFVGRRGFSGLSFLASHKPLELTSELFPLPRCGPDNVVGGRTILRGRRFELDRGHFVDIVQRTGVG